MLAARLIQSQGVYVEGINFYTGFCVEGHTHAIRQHHREREKRNNALWVAEQLGIKLHIIDVVEEYKSIVTKPRYGYGTYLNPCLDCKVFMVDKARAWMEKNQFDFIISGEVIGQRPKSQLRKTMPIIAEKSGANDRLLRPLCAQYLPETLPEREGWVERDQLQRFSGRSRKPQMALAKQLDLHDYSQPAGGCCFLTNPHYSAKLADMWKHRGKKHYQLDDIMLLKVGRHLRPQPHFKLIISREEGENYYLEGYRKQFRHIFPVSHKGPLTLIEADQFSTEDATLAARIVARFGKGRDSEQVTVRLVSIDGSEKQLTVKPLPERDILKEWYI